MKRCLFAILVASCLLVLPHVQNGNVPSARASSSVFEGDLILAGNDETVIEGAFDINGSIIVEENAVLVLRNAVVNFTQVTDYQFNMSFQNAVNGNPRLQVENATVTTNDHYMNIDLHGNSSANINGLNTTDQVYLRTYLNSSASVSESTVGYMQASDVSVLSVSDSSFLGVWSRDNANMDISNCTFSSLEAEKNSTITVSNSSISFLVVTDSWSVNYSVSKYEPCFVSYWDFQRNCSVAVADSDGNAPNVTLADTQVGGWGFSSYGTSNLTVSDSRLFGLWARDSSVLSLENSTISYSLWSHDLSIWHISNTTIEGLRSYEYSKIWLVNSTSNAYYIYDASETYVSWYLDAHVTDHFDQDVPSANVTVHYPNTTEVDSKTTGANGRARLTLMEKTMNATGEYPIGNYTIVAAYEDQTVAAKTNMTSNKQIALRLEGLVIPEYPSLLNLQLLLIIELLAVTVYKRKTWKSTRATRV